MGRVKDLTNQRFGRLVVVKFEELNKNRTAVWLCLCDCGNYKSIVGASLTNKLTKSCGCLKDEKTSQRFLIDLTGKRFGRLVVIERSKKTNKRKEVYWKCICDCGNFREVTSSCLNSGDSTSCGCKNKDRLTNDWIKENHPNWKGGTSNLNIYLRYCLDEWKQESLKNGNYKCAITNENKNLEIHHLFPFNKIIKESLNILNLEVKYKINEFTSEDLKKISNICQEINYSHGLGVCLTKELHKEFHDKYGKTYFTPENFQEFYFLKTGKYFDLDKMKVGELTHAI